MDTLRLADRLTAEVKKAMGEQGISQREMSRRTGIPLNTLNARLQGSATRSFNMGELGSVLGVLHLSLVELAVRAERQPVAA